VSNGTGPTRNDTGGYEQCSFTPVYRPVFLWLQPITWQLLSLATPPTLKGTLYESKMVERRPSERDFDTELIECVKNRPILWDSWLDDYKLAQKKPAMWLEIADKLGSSASFLAEY